MSEDLIKRIDALVAIRNLYPAKPKIDFMDTISNWRQKNRQYMECERAIEELPSATHSNDSNALNALDSVSRQAALDAIDEIESEVADGDGFQYEKWRQYFNDLPSAEPRWIPVTERLPKPNETVGRVLKHYLVQDTYGDMLVGIWDGVEWKMSCSIEVIDDVVAWMPLPEPWKGGTK